MVTESQILANRLNAQKSRSVAQTPHQLSLAHDYSVRGITNN
jgi:hypothetical protein